jgi:hypothetical protein
MVEVVQERRLTPFPGDVCSAQPWIHSSIGPKKNADTFSIPCEWGVCAESSKRRRHPDFLARLAIVEAYMSLSRAPSRIHIAPTYRLGRPCLRHCGQCVCLLGTMSQFLLHSHPTTNPELHSFHFRKHQRAQGTHQGNVNNVICLHDALLWTRDAEIIRGPPPST